MQIPGVNAVSVTVVTETVLLVVELSAKVVLELVVDVVVVVIKGHSGRQPSQNHCWHALYQPPA